MSRTLFRRLLDLEYPIRRVLTAPGRVVSRWRNRQRLDRPEGGAVDVFAVDGRLILEGWAWWIGMGAWTTSGHVQVISDEQSDSELGDELMDALERSASTRVRHGGKDREALLNAAGVPSERALQRSAKYVAVRSEGGVVSLMPGRPLAGGWVTDSEDEAIRLIAPGPEQLGRALRNTVGS